MARILLIADVHSNWPALKALLADAGRVDFIIHAGDTIGYGPYPNECASYLREHGNVNVMGNHDYAVVSGDYTGFGDNADLVLRWTDEVITAQNLKYLSNLGDTWVGDVFGVKVGVVHGGLSNPLNEFIHPYSDENLVDSYFKKMGVKLLITGHVHQMFVRELASGYLINPGGAGQPRDNNPQPSYIIIYIENGEITRIEPHRFNYPIEEFQIKQSAEKLPSVFAERLFNGR